MGYGYGKNGSGRKCGHALDEEWWRVKIMWNQALRRLLLPRIRKLACMYIKLLNLNLMSHRALIPSGAANFKFYYVFRLSGFSIN